ncbi:tRNA-splicing ligase RtcB like protein [Fukomys damarensis]|uniref:3'-phosphate/5'-hydroxy nucleic acid ligase n=1 Tax=Fukomys damarensis TaxID=885580 RepID=A0A091D6C8_FUKDA|nr:tRNA-splicing ligase RtcB like protein [Fukomys damarensis]
MNRAYCNDELHFLEDTSKNSWEERTTKGFVPNMQVKGVFYVNDAVENIYGIQECLSREDYVWAKDKEHWEEYGRVLQANPNNVSVGAKKRDLPQLATLGASNHDAEIQFADEIFNEYAAKEMGMDHKGQMGTMMPSGGEAWNTKWLQIFWRL